MKMVCLTTYNHNRNIKQRLVVLEFGMSKIEKHLRRISVLLITCSNESGFYVLYITIDQNNRIFSHCNKSLFLMF